MADLRKLSDLIRRRNAIAREVTAIIGRPAQIGHLGEHIASEIFGIALEESASNKGFDGRFRSGPLAGKSVNIKWFGKEEGILDIKPNALPDYYLVLTGPRKAPATSRGEARPWLIEHVFLFEASALVATLREHGVSLNEATSVRKNLWDAAEIYPSQKCSLLPMSDAQRALLRMFSGETTAP